MKKGIKTILKGTQLFLSLCFMFLLFSQTLTAKAAQTTININDLTSWDNVTSYLDDAVGDNGGGGMDLTKFYIANDSNYIYYRWDITGVTNLKSTNLGVAVGTSASPTTAAGMVWLEYDSKEIVTAKVVNLSTSAESTFSTADVIQSNTGTGTMSVVTRVPYSAFTTAGLTGVTATSVFPLWAQTNASQQPNSNAKDRIPDAGYFSYNAATGTGVIVGAGLSTAKDILTFSINGQAGSVNASNHTVTVSMPLGTDMTSLKPTFTLSANAKGAYVGGVLQKSGVTAQNFTNILTYTVVAQDGSTQDWTVNVVAPYTVTFNANGGTVSPATQTKLLRAAYGKASDGTTAEAMPVPTRTGYTFNGWYDGVGGTGNLITDSTTMTTASNQTLYAKWTINSYTVTFKDYDGTTLSTQSVNYGSAATAPANPSRTGYTFAGWDASYSNISSALTVTAQYSANSYTVTFDPQGGDAVSPGSKGITFDSAYGTLPVPTRAGYAFGGWYTEPNGGGIRILDTTQVTNAADHTLYAKWVIPTITLKGQKTNATTVDFDSSYTIPKDSGITREEVGFYIIKTSSTKTPSLSQMTTLGTKIKYTGTDIENSVEIYNANTAIYKYWAVSYLKYKIGETVYTIYSTIEKVVS